MAKTLPTLPPITDDQYTYLIGVFTELAAEWDLAGPAEAYVYWSHQHLIALTRSHAVGKVNLELDAQRDARMAEVNAMLNTLISGA